MGSEKTIELAQREFYWPSMNKEIKWYVKTCWACQCSKPRNNHPNGLLQPLPIPTRRWEQVTMDLISPLPKTRRGHDAIVVFVDKLSKMIHCVPTHSSVTAPGLARITMNEVVRHHGVPSSLVSDRDVRFIATFWKSLWKLMGTSLNMSTAFHPETDGQTENSNRSIIKMLRAYVNYEQDDWDDRLVAIEYAYNNSKHASTGFSPFYLNTGQHPKHPTAPSPPSQQRSDNPVATQFIEQLNKDLIRAKENIQKAIDKQKKYADQHRQPVTFSVGDQVMLSTQNLPKPLPGLAHKLLHVYYGPFSIKSKVSDVVYELELPATWKVYPKFHVNLLKPYYDGSQVFPSRPLPERPPPALVDGQQEWVVDRIIGKRYNRRRLEYKVLWQGWPAHEATWEPVAHLRNAQAKIRVFERRANAACSHIC
jgi:hypothetical protein